MPRPDKEMWGASGSEGSFHSLLHSELQGGTIEQGQYVAGAPSGAASLSALPATGYFGPGLLWGLSWLHDHHVHPCSFLDASQLLPPPCSPPGSAVRPTPTGSPGPGSPAQVMALYSWETPPGKLPWPEGFKQGQEGHLLGVVPEGTAH